MLGLILFMSLMTYIIPAGEFATDPETGEILGDQFSFLPEQTPVSPWDALLSILPGFQNSSLVIALVLIAGGAIGVVMETGALAELVDWAVFRLKDRDVNVLVPLLFVLMGLLGGFGGGDQLIAVVPIGIMVAQKLRLDPICALAVTFMATIVGFSTSPTRVSIPQMMMGVPPYSGFLVRLGVMFLSIAIGAVYTLAYAKKIKKDPSKSLMGNTDWLNTTAHGEVKAVALRPRAVIVTILFFFMLTSVVVLLTVFKMPMSVMPAVQIPVAIICGLIYGMSFEKIGNVFAKGVSDMAFVGLVVGFAGSMSIVMSEGNIIHTIVHYACMPLRSLNGGTIAIGVSFVVLILNLFIPSATSKAAILIPIIQPMTQALGMSPQVAVQAFQVGDGFTNSLSPMLGWTAGAVQTAEVTFNKWWKFAVPLVIILTIISWVIIYFLGIMNWVGY